MGAVASKDEERGEPCFTSCDTPELRQWILGKYACVCFDLYVYPISSLSVLIPRFQTLTPKPQKAFYKGNDLKCWFKKKIPGK